MSLFKKTYSNIEPMKTENLAQTIYYTIYEIMNKPALKEENIGYQTGPHHAKLLAPKENQITWIGHATFLIQLDGLNILTDPIWRKNLAGNLRIHQPPFQIRKLPRIDVVLVSHGHFDHLDFSSILEIDQAWKPYFFIPVGLKRKFLRRGINHAQIIERDWGERIEGDGFEFEFVVAQHWTRRHLFDKNTSHWGGWMVRSDYSNQVIYFAGDTAYLNHMAQYTKHFGPIDYALMPIGAYEPSEQNHTVHANPGEAVEMFKDISAKYFIPMHYGTYSLGTDSGLEALEVLYRYWQAQNLDHNRLLQMNIGETFII